MVAELFPSRGFQSTVPHRLHFGVGNTSTVDSVLIQWPNGKESIYSDLPTNKVIEITPKKHMLMLFKTKRIPKLSCLPFRFNTRKIILSNSTESVY